MNSQARFQGQCAVVTGGTRGIGRAVVKALLAEGATVWATYQGNDAAAEALKAECAAHEGRLATAKFPVGDYAACEAFWAGLETAAPQGVQILVNNAGIRRDQIVGMMTPAEWNDVLQTNLAGSFHMSKFAVLSMMRRRYGRIVMVTSPAGAHGFQGQANYSASKAGQIGLMRSLAREVGKRKITVNCVSPGFIDTELIADLPEEVRKEHLAMVPVGRFGSVDEVAWAVLVLCSKEASYIHGTTLEVTGGI